MAIAQAFIFDEATGQTIDTRSMQAGWHGPHTALREATLFEAFGSAGTVTISTMSVATPSASPIPFKVISRANDGTIATVATGLFPANAYKADGASLGLSVATFTNALPSTDYAIVPDGTVTESEVRPGMYRWAEAPADGGGLVGVLVLAVA